MSDQNQNMEDFFKRRLDDLGTSGDWDRPRPMVRDAVLSQITKDKNEDKKTFWWIWILGLALVGSLIYIGISRVQINDLNNQVNDHQTQLSNKNNEITILNEELTREETRLNHEVEVSRVEMESLHEKITELNEVNLLGTYRQQQLRSDITRLNMVVGDWEYRYDKMATSYSALAKINDPNNEGKLGSESKSPNSNRDRDIYNKVEISTVAPLPLSLLKIDRIKIVDNKNISLTKPLIMNRKSFKAGYELTYHQIDLSTEKSFENQRIISDGLQIETAWALSHGIYGAYSPSERWWIRSGVSRAKLGMERQSQLGIGYNTDGEFRRPDASNGNVLVLNTETSFAGIESQIEIINPRGRNLSAGDLIELSIYEDLELNITRVPLGVEYVAGEDRLNWTGQLGVVWNRIEYQNYTIEVDGVAEVGGIPISRSEVSNTDIPSRSHINLYGGIGLRYSLYNNWMVQPSLLYQYNFNNPINSTKTSAGLQISIGYNF